MLAQHPRNCTLLQGHSCIRVVYRKRSRQTHPDFMQDQSKPHLNLPRSFVDRLLHHLVLLHRLVLEDAALVLLAQFTLEGRQVGPMG